MKLANEKYMHKISDDHGLIVENGHNRSNASFAQ